MMSLCRLLIRVAVSACLTPALICSAEEGTSMPAASDDTHGPIVKAPSGDVEGRLEGELRVFKGIPFALPPVGSARWRPPSPMPRWAGVKKVTEYGAACWQPKPTLSTIYTRNPMPMSEDCLTLNIWTPIHANNAPVFFWIYGGALVGGASLDPQSFAGIVNF